MKGDIGNFSGMIVPTALFLLSYAAIMTERINRAIVALMGACLAIVAGTLNQKEAVAAIDFNTIALLAGMMIIVGIARKSGLFGYIAVRAAQITRAKPAGILIALPLVTAALSALLDNVTTVLLIVPVTLSICSELQVRTYPFLIAEIFASNIGGTATLIGDPPNILIGSAVGLTFSDFVVALAPIVIVVFAFQTAINHLVWGRHMRSDGSHRARIMAMNASAAIEDHRLLKMSLAVIAGTIAAFVFARELDVEAGTIALFGAAVLMLLDSIPRPREHHAEAISAALNEVEWVTIFFFIGLFVLVGALQKAGVLDFLARELLVATGGDLKVTALGILWGSAVLSAVVDNIPFVASMIPLVKNLAPALGGNEAILPLWWALALGACLGGNGTLIGASANLIVVGIAERSGAGIGFWRFSLTAFPLMLLSIALCHVYVVWRFF
jgi:Na+/H+ antiporter NhaD/arsenite permease-like protein